MKLKVLRAIPEVFSLRGNDYSSFVVKGGAEQMMRDAWVGVGQRMLSSMSKVDARVLNKKKKAHPHVPTKEVA